MEMWLLLFKSQKQLIKWQTNKARRELGRGNEGGEGVEKNAGKVGTEAERRKSGKKEQDEEGSEGVSLPTVASAG